MPTSVFSFLHSASVTSAQLLHRNGKHNTCSFLSVQTTLHAIALTMTRTIYFGCVTRARQIEAVSLLTTDNKLSVVQHHATLYNSLVKRSQLTSQYCYETNSYYQRAMPMRSLERTVALFVRLSVWDRRTLHCDHTVHASADLTLRLDSPMSWAPWYQTCPPILSRLFQFHLEERWGMDV